MHLCERQDEQAYAEWIRTYKHKRHRRNDFKFFKRRWVKHRTKKPAKKGAKKVKEAFTMTAANCIKLCAGVVSKWYAFKKSKITQRRQRRQIYHVHDNSRGWISKKVRAHWKESDVPIYPAGGIYGFHGGFPPYSPDFNCIAEYACGYVKTGVAKLVACMPASERYSLTVKDLAAIVRKVFASITQTMMLNWERKMKRHIQECLNYGGKYGPSVRHLNLVKTKVRLAQGRPRIHDSTAEESSSDDQGHNHNRRDSGTEGHSEEEKFEECE